MKKAIGYRFVIVLIFALLISGIISYIVAGRQILNSSIEHMTQIIRTIDLSMDYNGDIQKQIMILKEKAVGENDRITVLRLDGSVCADTDTQNVSSLENHRDREEIQEALDNKAGSAVRKSHTLGKEMLYVAIKSENEEYVIRLSKYYDGLTDYMRVLLPSLLLGFMVVLSISLLIAFRLTEDITKPLNEIAEEMLHMEGANPEFDFKTYKYQELNIISYTTDKLTESVKDYIDKVNFEKIVRQEFFSNASHELKTPITSIRGYAELLQNGIPRDEETKEDCIRRIIKETENMTNLINDILMISKLETNEASIEISEVRLSPLLNEVAESLQPFADTNQVTLHLDCQPIMLEGSRQQMHELLTNLITNAIKYNNPEGEVWVEISRSREELIIVVKDNGIGISKEDCERVFERFYRVDKGRSKKIGGTGLGLSIVKHIVAFYNGEIDLESEIGKGSTFTIHIPITKERIVPL